ncbi:MAG TPA: TIGR04282 family arsenosugar biosynthesis glycosyltransferase [Mycobacteriales bacterium]|jgi:hypothetical protein|nr:TIGR04282 family arsenosugar biosynthesis glycosyltransferase [Mycobacteriales bacterium]
MNAANVTGQLLVLAKRPIAGRVKTRLCPPCTPQEAAGVAAAALADTLDAVRRTPVTRRVVAFDGPTESTVDLEAIRQRGDGLGERIANAFADTAARNPDPVVQIGMDTPQVTPELLTAALQLLAHNDAVLGLAEDGGWWALGLRDAHRASVLPDVPMSTSDTGRLTIAALEGAGARIGYLPRLRDVDTIDDAQLVAESVPGSRFARAVEELSCTAR